MEEEEPPTISKYPSSLTLPTMVAAEEELLSKTPSGSGLFAFHDVSNDESLAVTPSGMHRRLAGHTEAESLSPRILSDPIIGAPAVVELEDLPSRTPLALSLRGLQSANEGALLPRESLIPSTEIVTSLREEQHQFQDESADSARRWPTTQIEPNQHQETEGIELMPLRQRPGSSRRPSSLSLDYF